MRRMPRHTILKSSLQCLDIGRALNFQNCWQEMRKPVPSRPIVFAKGLNTLVGNGATIRIPNDENKVDFEGELAVVIGKRCKNVEASQARHA